MKDNIKVLSDTDKGKVVLINRASDPGMWILNTYKKFLFFKIRKASHWFNSEKEALEFAGQS